MTHAHITKRITIAQAEERGFAVDTYCYPHLGYKGSRFRPDESVYVYTELEAELMEFKLNHKCRLPDSINEAFNSGDGVYRP